MSPPRPEQVHLHRRWDAEACVLGAPDRAALLRRVDEVRACLDRSPDAALRDVAYTLNVPAPADACRLGVVATSVPDLATKLAYARGRLADPACRRIRERSGVYYFDEPLGPAGALAFLFPGEGSQYPDMLADLAIHFPEVRAWFDLMDRAFAGHPRGFLPSDVIFPPGGAARPTEVEAGALWQMDAAVEAVFVASQALHALLGRLGLRPRAVVGHSTGEYSALMAAGAVRVASAGELIGHIVALNARYQGMAAQGRIPRATLLAVGGAARVEVERLVEESGGALFLAMDNCPHQLVLCGAPDAAAQAAQRLATRGAICQTLPFDRAYHTPLFQDFCEPLRGFFERLTVEAPRVELYSCITADRFPEDPAAIRELAVTQWARPVRFRETVEVLHERGIRVFVEVGPRGNLTSFVGDVLRGRPHVAVASNVAYRSGLEQLAHMVALLAAHHVPLELAPLYEHRAPRRVDFDAATAAEEPRRRAMVLPLGLPVLTVEERGAGAAAAPAAGAVAAARSALAATPVERPGPAATGRAGGEVSVTAAHVARALPAPRPGVPAGVMAGYMASMSAFLQTQQEVMAAYLRRSGRKAGNGATPGNGGPPSARLAAAVPAPPPAPASGATGTAAAPPLPFVREIVELEPGRAATVRCPLDLARDDFLRDHTLGGRVSVLDPGLIALPVLPLAIGIEMLAEAASLVLPGRVVAGVRDVRAHRWIALEDGTLELTLVARRAADDAGAVEVRLADTEGEALLEGTVLLAEGYAAPPPPEELPAANGGGPSRWTPDRLYAEAMFTGPRFRGVASMDRVGGDGAVATLRAPAAASFFRDAELRTTADTSTDAASLLDPVLLDAAGQVVGFWTAERLAEGFVIFPTGLAELRLFGPPAAAGTIVSCHAAIRLPDDERVESDLLLRGADGRPLALLRGWQDRRFRVSREFAAFVLAPGEQPLSRPAPEQVAALFDGDVRVSWLDASTAALRGTDAPLWERVLAHLVLVPAERAAWRALPAVRRRRYEWLLGRLAAKEAVCRLVRETRGLRLCPADVQLVPDAHGRPVVRGGWLTGEDPAPALSLSHSHAVALAAAADGTAGAAIGVDLERLPLPSEGFAQVALDASERVLLSEVQEDRLDEWTLRCWCAKEAVAKALGRGMVAGPAGLVVRRIEPEHGTVWVALAGAMAEEHAAHAGRELRARTALVGEFVVAGAQLPRS